MRVALECPDRCDVYRLAVRGEVGRRQFCRQNGHGEVATDGEQNTKGKEEADGGDSAEGICSGN